jgi:transposase-like protein
MAKLSVEEYVQHGGLKCPSCGAGNVEGQKGVEIDGGTAWQSVSCTDCDATWTDLYTLTGYDDLEEGG